MIGGIIQVSNDTSFQNNVTLCEFSDTLRSNNITIECQSYPTRYLRYIAPTDKNIEIAELHVYDKYGMEIPFQNIYANHHLDTIHVRNLKLIYDNIWSSFYMSVKGESLTFDFGKKVEIKNILFVPRNDDNYIRKGQLYELFYHDGINGWRSLEKKVAETDSMIFHNVPSNAVFWLHNHSEGVEERCFYEANGYQRFI